MNSAGKIVQTRAVIEVVAFFLPYKATFLTLTGFLKGTEVLPHEACLTIFGAPVVFHMSLLCT